MKFNFKIQPFQTEAVENIVRVFGGQPKQSPMTYRRDVGRHAKPAEVQITMFTPETESDDGDTGYRNAAVELDDARLLSNIREIQTESNIKLSPSLVKELGAVSLDVEMETGTGKTYVYIKTIFELNARYGWSKFIVVVPSIAIREGVKKSFEITQEHFMEQYGIKARFFVYNSANLHQLDEFSSGFGINVMIINIQAFATSLKEDGRSKESRIIYSKRDEFGSRRPIDVIKANRPIIILDEPQKMGGAATQNALKNNFSPLFSLNYSATHKTSHNLVYVLDALDAFRKKLVKKIEVKGFDIKNLRGTDKYVYLAEIVVAPNKPPRARLEFEMRMATGAIKRATQLLGVGDSLHAASNGLEQYRGLIVSEVDPITKTVTFGSGDTLATGVAAGDVNESDIRRIQIRETILSHFEKEEQLFLSGIKCLSLFFIDEVAKYRRYGEDGEELLGEYGEIFEQEYANAVYSFQLSVFRREMEKHGCVKLPGIESLAESDGFDRRDLPFGKKTAKGRNICVSGSNEAGGGVDSVEHCGGAGQRFTEGLRSLSDHSQRVKGGIGDAITDLRQGGIPCRFGYYGSNGTIEGNRGHVDCPHFQTENCPLKTENSYLDYLRGIEPHDTHRGYFSIDKQGRAVDSAVKRGSEFSDDISAYDLILKNKERLLSFDEPTRFIFSHSALREGWDNPNVFQICTLKHSENATAKRQEVGRGLRLCVNQAGDRQDVDVCGDTAVHDVNKLTVIASESYAGFVSDLQNKIKEDLYDRPTKASVEYFAGKFVYDGTEAHAFTVQEATAAYNYLIRNDYVDDNGNVTAAYREAAEAGSFAPMKPEIAPYAEGIHKLVQGIFDPSVLDSMIEDGHDTKVKGNPLNDNWSKQEFQELWKRINQRYAYTVEFDSPELVSKSVAALNASLRVTKLQYTLTKGVQTGAEFDIERTQTRELKHAAGSLVRYDLIGKIAERATLTRHSAAEILKGLNFEKRGMFSLNPEEFIQRVALEINHQKAAIIVEHISYQPSAEEPYTQDIFNMAKSSQEYAKAFHAKKSIQEYVFTDGTATDSIERKFAESVDTADEVVVYAKLPRGPKGFYIPTPVGNYSPDWAIAFRRGAVKHIFFIAETKGTMDSLNINPIEKAKISCAKKLFNEISTTGVKYHDVDSYQSLLDVMQTL